MRVFLCSFGDFALAIPMFSVSSLTNLEDRSVQYNAAANDAVMHDQGNHNTYISLPQLFNLADINVRHCVILNNPDGTNDDTDKNKIVLISPEVVREIEIPDEEIHVIPEVLIGTHFSMLFTGIHLSDTPVLVNPVLVLNPEQLMEYAKQETVE